MLQKTSHGAQQKLINPERILEERETGEIVDQIVPCLVIPLMLVQVGLKFSYSRVQKSIEYWSVWSKMTIGEVGVSLT